MVMIILAFCFFVGKQKVIVLVNCDKPMSYIAGLSFNVINITRQLYLNKFTMYFLGNFYFSF